MYEKRFPVFRCFWRKNSNVFFKWFTVQKFFNFVLKVVVYTVKTFHKLKKKRNFWSSRLISSWDILPKNKEGGLNKSMLFLMIFTDRMNIILFFSLQIWVMAWKLHKFMQKIQTFSQNLFCSKSSKTDKLILVSDKQKMLAIVFICKKSAVNKILCMLVDFWD